MNGPKLLNNMDQSEGNDSNITGDISYPLISTEKHLFSDPFFELVFGSFINL